MPRWTNAFATINLTSKLRMVVRTPSAPTEHCLLAFDSLVRRGSIPAAASELGVSRSTLRRSLTLLEHQLGCKVFRSHSTEVVLTEAGKAYFSSARKFLTHVQLNLGRIHAGTRVNLRVGSCSAIVRHMLAPELGKFRAMAPYADLELATTSVEEQDSWRTQFDAVLWYGFKPSTMHGVQILWAGNSVTYASPLVRLCPDLPRICWSEGEILAAKGLTSQQVLIAHDLMIALELACGGSGYVDCPRELAMPYVVRGKLTPVSAVMPDPRCLYLVCAGGASTEATEALAQWLMQSAKSLLRTC